MNNIRFYVYALIAAFMLALPAHALVDDVLCSSADSGGTSCNATQLKVNGSEEFDAHSKRAPIWLDQTSGTDTIVATASSTTAKPLVAYTNGQPFYLKPDNTITGPATLNIDTVGAIAIQSSAGGALGAGDMRSDTVYSLVYYSAGPAFRVLTSLGAGSAAGSNNYVTIGNTGALTNERALTAGTAITITDAGVNSTVTVAVTAAAIGTTQIGTDGVTADELNATGVEAELEAVMDLQDLHGALIAAQLTAIDTSAEIRSLMTDEIGTGVLFFLGAPASDDQVFVSSSTSAGAWGTLPDSDGAAQKLQYDQTTNAFSAGTDDDIPDAGDFTNLALSGDVVSSALVTTIQANSVALGTDTTGNYALGDAEGGAATTGDSATAFFSVGTIERARGGLASDISAIGTGILGSDGSNAFVDIDTSTEVAAAISDETGSGALVFATSPTLVTPALGTPSALVLTNATGLGDGGIANDAVDGGSGGEIQDGTIDGEDMNSNYAGDGLVETAGSPDTIDISLNATGPGLAIASDTLSLLRSCGDGQILKWTLGTTSWGCANDAGAGGGITAVVDDTSPTLGGDLEGGGFDLGTSASQADDIFLLEGSVINFDAGDLTITQTGNVLAISGGLLTGASVDAASATAVGTVELATPAEVLTGTSTTLAVTPEGAKRIPGQERCVAASDQGTSITTGTNKIIFPAFSVAWTVTGVYAMVNTAPTGSTIIIDINEDPDAEGGSASATILSTKLSIDASERRSSTAASAAVISDTALGAHAEMAVDFDQVGSTIPGKGVVVCLQGYPT